MGIFGDESERLLRKTWTSPEELAQELYSIFSDTGPLQIDSPVQIQTNSPDPALTITNTFGGTGAVGLQVNGGTVSNGPSVFGGSAFTYDPTIGGVAGSVQNVYFPANGPVQDVAGSGYPVGSALGSLGSSPPMAGFLTVGQGPPGAPGPNAPAPPPPDTAGCYVGIVQSGTGSTYLVTLYPQGFDYPEGNTVTVTIPNIDPKEVIPAGTKIVGVVRCVTKTLVVNEPANVYYWQPPVWS